MTTLASVPASTAAHRPVPGRQLAWVAWRRNRATVFGLGGLLAALAAYLLVTGLQMHSAYDDLGSCVPPITTDACRIRWDSFINGYGQRGLTGPLLVLLPGIVGAVVGAPLVGRELESGVFRYSWTQGVGRMRWTVAIVLPIVVLTAALMGALGLLVAWRNGPLSDAGVAQRLDGTTFPTTGVAVMGWTLLALSTGVLAGLLWRRVVPAVASSFAVWFGVALLASARRPYLVTPLTSIGDPPTGSLDVASSWTKNGAPVSASEVSSVLESVGVQMREDGFSAHVGGGSPAPTDPIIYLSEHGYIQVHSYQPDSRYWTFQWMELGWLVLLSLALLGLTFWLIRRRSI